MAAGGRQSRSDAGIIALSRDLLTKVFGLTPDTVGKVMKIIRNSGQLQDLKRNMRGMNAVAYKRLNQVIDLVEKQQKDQKGSNKEKGSEGRMDSDREAQDTKRKPVTETFLGYLLSELQINTDDLRSDPELKRDVLRLTRAPEQQADQIQTRMGREQIRDERQEIRQEKDPQRAALKRKRMGLKKQIARVDQQLAAVSDEETGEPSL